MLSSVVMYENRSNLHKNTFQQSSFIFMLILYYISDLGVMVLVGTGKSNLSTAGNSLRTDNTILVLVCPSVSLHADPLYPNQSEKPPKEFQILVPST